MATRARRKSGKPAPPSSGPKPPFLIVGVGASAGGLEAFTQLLRSLPRDTGLAFVLIQHLDPTHASLLSEALARATAMSVHQARDGEAVAPNHVYVIPPDADLEMRRGRLKLLPRLEEARRPHLPVDRFLRSLAAERGGYAIGVILSGTGSDGVEGLAAIKAEGGITFAQDPSTAKFSGMPESAIQAGLVDYRLGLEELATELVRLSRHPYVAGRVAHASEPALRKVLELVRASGGVDFGEYKRATVERRLIRRMALRHLGKVEEYHDLLQRDPLEVRALHEDLLIQVTSFFRDPEVTAGLKAFVFPEILKQKRQNAPIRLWSAGCSSGQEAYSLAIALLEFLGSAVMQHPVQIFGSDVSEKLIDRARAGFFPDAAMEGVDEERRRRYFTRTENGYRIAKSVRDICVFVRHDLARDPPFSRIDLVSCRNVLIYFEQALQKRVVSTFHYALNQPGYLVLGRSESISGFGRLFTRAATGLSIYTRSSSPSALRFPARADQPAVASPRRGGPDPVSRPHLDLSRRLDRLLLSRYAPASVLINDRLEILQFRGQTGAFLAPAPGEPQSNVVKMARPGLLAPLRATITKARKERAPVRAEGVEVDQDGRTQRCNLEVLPFPGVPETKELLFLVLFESPPARGSREPEGRRRTRPRLGSERRAEHELAATRDYLQSLIEEHARTSEELESANEELISGNEELQSMNEEMETAKEELQSTNEELITVNDELHNRNQELSVVNADLLNLLTTVDIPLLILDARRRIRRVTPRARDILNVLPSDVGRPVDDIRPNIQVADLDRQVARVIETTRATESEVQDPQGRWYRLQIRPYRTMDDAIGGAILLLVDIDLLKHHVAEATEAKAEAERANESKNQFLATLSHELRSSLSVMMTHAQLLQRGPLDPEKVRHAGEVIQRATQQQVQLIDDLLDVSRIAAGKLLMDMRPIDLLGVVKDSLEVVGAAAERKSIALQTRLGVESVPVSGDPARLQQVVTNLLTNAVKFTPVGGKVAVELARDDSRARVTIADTGIGIDPKFLPHIFERFAQEDPDARQTNGGLGLGLAIVQHLVQAHHGTIQAASEGRGRGATFTITLPLLSPREAARAAARDASSGGNGSAGQAELDSAEALRGVRILVADDDVLIRETLCEMLRQSGALVTAVGSADEAMRAVVEQHPGVLVSDLSMPGQDGFDLIRRLRARGESLPALALSVMAGKEDRQRALQAGFQMHMAKPADIQSLVLAVAELARSGAAAPPPASH